MPLSPSAEEQRRWLALARASIASVWHPEPLPELMLGDQIVDLFVTLHTDGELRGCIGATNNDRPLAESIAYLARQCAFADPRFPPLTEAELARSHISISALGPKRPLPASDRAALEADLCPGEGLILKQGGRQAIFLPQVWEGVRSKTAFVDALMRKGGWHHWSPGMQAQTFDCLVVQEGLEP
ncbi:AmmeMemoRadiSam system protein A [Ferrimonas balearica]|uniref:AmmeMemoRadiSam system protein A n=1 Tax=Ferrimonas balearica TaxID=44012 RepID=UPI001C999AF3|nr:AmmeMemoRadiSam system protein A [Ferrimonas balearica]MBY5921785.1 AmmeMemoRadiSam system protein A [Ferrimonas balearica]MBY5994875.1 AmmeMemoRadiSam system protein A [Ferrimonas balearica]